MTRRNSSCGIDLFLLEKAMKCATMVEYGKEANTLKMDTYFAEYRRKLVTADEAAGLVNSGDTIVIGVNFSEPPALLKAIADKVRAGELGRITTYSFNPQKHAVETVFAVDLADCITTCSWFISRAIRNLVRVGLSYYVPAYLHQVPRFIREHMDAGVTVASVSPMDKAGFFSFGAASYITGAARASKKVILEVNENVPRVFGDSMIHVSEVDALVENHVPLLEPVKPEIRPADVEIGKRIAELVRNGACIQLGIGCIPNAVTAALSEHRDLGIHSELFVPGMVDLIKKGVVTGSKKTFHTRKHLFSVAFGPREMYSFMHDNPSMETYSSEYIMDPSNIARNSDMVSINSILEVDLTGQCNAETIEGFQFSGTGGQLDFVRGAYNSPGGISILAFYATAKNGTVSRVVPRLGMGAGITTPRMDCHYLTTEYGIVNLKGKSTRDRALAIIGLAHPKFRDELVKEADDLRLI